MFLIIVSLLLAITRFQVILSDMQDNRIDEAPYKREITYDIIASSDNKEKIWVLELNDGGLETLKLREPDEDDEEDFEFYSQPLVENYIREHGVVKKDAPKSAKAQAMDKNTIAPKKPVSKEEIFKYLNKFGMYSKTDSDGYQSDSHENDDPSIALYFRGPFTSLIVKQGIRQWHYFIPPPSLLPAWFYQPHAAPEEVPETVADNFYPALFRLLQVLLRYPV